MTKRLSITVFFPYLNDWGTIGSLVILAICTLQSITDDYEVIVINDGSNESSREILEMVEKHLDKVRIVNHPVNKGYGGALRSGIIHATKDLIFYTDGDAQYDVRELKKLIPFLTEDKDIVNGYKIKRADPIYRKVIGRVYHYIIKLFFRVPIRDTDCDFRLMRRRIFDKVHLESDSGVICVEMIKKIHDAGFQFAEVPVHHYFRASGKSQFFNFRRVGRVGIDLIRLWWKLVIRKEHMRMWGGELN